VKLDRSFVNNILTNPRDARLIRGVIALAKGLELELVAEGVETIEQQQHLAAIGCRYMQGYLYCKPCPADEYILWLLAQPNTP
jgi:EAL domain-containing protein (putative c-di-GMP-specific phosphodiesterase class I)